MYDKKIPWLIFYKQKQYQSEEQHMQITTSMLNNKVYLSKGDTHAMPRGTSPCDTLGEFVERKVIDEQKSEAVKELLGFIEKTVDIAIQCVNGNAPTTDIAGSSADDEDLKAMHSNVADALIGATVMKSNSSIAVNRAVTKDRREDRREDRQDERQEEREEFTVEKGQLCYKGTPIDDGMDDNSKERVSTFKNINAIPDELQALLDDITTDISTGDNSNMTTYAEQLSVYKNSIQNVKAVLEYENTGEVVAGNSSTIDGIDEANNRFSNEEIIILARKKDRLEATLEVAKAAIGFVDDTIEIARKCLSGETSTLELAVIMRMGQQEMQDKVYEAQEKVTDNTEDTQRLAALLEVDRTLAVKTSTVDNRMEEREEERNEPKVTVENGEISHNGTAINDGTAEDPNTLITLISDILAGAKVVDTSNIESYLEKLNGYKGLLQVIQDDLEHEDPAKAIEKHKEQEATYLACLSMQTKITPETLSDYVS